MLLELGKYSIGIGDRFAQQGQAQHVGYKIAARKNGRYLGLLKACEPIIARNVTVNLFERHLKPLFIGHSNASVTFKPPYSSHARTLSSCFQNQSCSEADKNGGLNGCVRSVKSADNGARIPLPADFRSMRRSLHRERPRFSGAAWSGCDSEPMSHFGLSPLLRVPISFSHRKTRQRG